MNLERRSAPRRARAGFTLLELIVVLTVLAIMAGAAVPVAQKALTSAARKATRAELEAIAAASLEYFKDCNAVPASVVALERRPTGAVGTLWDGPYLTGAVTDSGGSSVALDAWLRSYRVVAGTTLVVTSAGEGGTFGDTDDLSVTIDFTPIRREQTLAEMAIINRAILNYNAVYQTTNPLSANWTLALRRLILTGFLPNSTEYQRDAWNRAYTADPAGAAPMVKVRSPSL